MTKVFATKEAQDLLKAAANVESQSGNARAKQIVGRLLTDLFKAIDDLDMTPDEIWAGVNYFNKLGQDGEAALLAAGSALKSTSTFAWMLRTGKPRSTGARRVPLKARSMSPVPQCTTGYQRSTATPIRKRALWSFVAP